MTAYQTQADPTAVGGKRIVAVIIDWGIWIAIYLVVFFVLAESADTGGFVTCADLDMGSNQCIQAGDTIYAVEGGEANILSGLQLLYMIGIFVVMRGLTGKTPGTLAMGLQCVNEQGQPIGIGMGFVRSIAGVVDYLPCCFPLVGTILIFTGKGHRRVGDMAAKSFMVDKSAAGMPISVPGLTPPGLAAGAGGPYAGTAPMGQPMGQPAAWPAAGAPTAPAAAAPTGAGEPQWDEARQAYIQWDPAQQVWLQFDQATQQWRPIQ